MIYILAAVGLYFILNFVGYVMQQNKETSTTLKIGGTSINPLEAQRIKQQYTPLMTGEMMSERIVRIYASTQGFTFEQFQYNMRFVLDKDENISHQKSMKEIFEKEKQFVEKYGFNMNEAQLRIAISNQALLLDETESPYW